MQYLHGNGSREFATFFLLAIRDAPSFAATRPEIRRSSQWISTSATPLFRGHSTRGTHRKSFLGHSMPRGIRPRNIYIKSGCFIHARRRDFRRQRQQLSFDSGSFYRRFRRKNVRLRPTGSALGYGEGGENSPDKKETNTEMFDSCRCEIASSYRPSCSFRRIAAICRAER